jgi:hypothetical protein
LFTGTKEYCNTIGLVWFGLWCLTPLSTIFQLYRGGQFYWWGKPEYLEKTTSCRSHWQTWSHNVVSSTRRHELTTLVVIGTDCTGSCKSNYHTIMTTTAHTTLVVIGTDCTGSCKSNYHTITTTTAPTTLVVIGTDCTGSCKSNYHTIMTTTAPTTLVVIDTDCTGSCKSNYHTIMTTTAPQKQYSIS